MKLETITIVPTKPWLTYDAPRWMRIIESFIRRRIFRQRPYLIDKWTIAEETSEPTLYGLDCIAEALYERDKKIKSDRQP